VLSDRSLCDELITRPEESYRLCCVVVCDLEKITLMNEDEDQDPLRGYRAKRKKSTFINKSSENELIKDRNTSERE